MFHLIVSIAWKRLFYELHIACGELLGKFNRAVMSSVSEDQPERTGCFARTGVGIDERLEHRTRARVQPQVCQQPPVEDDESLVVGPALPSASHLFERLRGALGQALLGERLGGAHVRRKRRRRDGFDDRFGPSIVVVESFGCLQLRANLLREGQVSPSELASSPARGESCRHERRVGGAPQRAVGLEPLHHCGSLSTQRIVVRANFTADELLYHVEPVAAVGIVDVLERRQRSSRVLELTDGTQSLGHRDLVVELPALARRAARWRRTQQRESLLAPTELDQAARLVLEHLVVASLDIGSGGGSELFVDECDRLFRAASVLQRARLLQADALEARP